MVSPLLPSPPIPPHLIRVVIPVPGITGDTSTSGLYRFRPATILTEFPLLLRRCSPGLQNQRVLLFREDLGREHILFDSIPNP